MNVVELRSALERMTPTNIGYVHIDVHGEYEENLVFTPTITFNDDNEEVEFPRIYTGIEAVAAIVCLHKLMNTFKQPTIDDFVNLYEDALSGFDGDEEDELDFGDG